MKYIFFDIDGTILSHSKGILPSTVKAIEEAKGKGHRLFLCTGRSLAEISDGYFKFGFNGYVCAAGSYVKVDDKVIFDKSIKEHTIDNLIYYSDKLNLRYTLEGEEYAYYHDRGYEFYKKKIEEYRNAPDRNALYPLDEYYLPMNRAKPAREYFKNRTKISKLVLYAKNQQDYVELEKYIDKDFYLIKYDHYAELIMKGINKFVGIEKVMEYFGADLEDTVAIGDSMNDYDMIKNAHIGIAMGNSPDRLKEAADFVTDHVDNGGLYKALKELDII